MDAKNPSQLPPKFNPRDGNNPGIQISEKKIDETYDNQLRKVLNNPSISHAMNNQIPINIGIPDQKLDNFNKQNQGDGYNPNQYISEPKQSYGKYDSGQNVHQEPRVFLFVFR